MGAEIAQTGQQLRFRCIIGVLKSALSTFAVLIGIAAVTDPHAELAAEISTRDVTGLWRIDIKQDRRRCQWQGQVRLNQNGSLLTGEGEAAATRGKRFCPRLKGNVEGSVNGAQVKFGFATGRLGTGEFDGNVVASGRMLRGTWSAGSAAGTWQAELLDQAN